VAVAAAGLVSLGPASFPEQAAWAQMRGFPTVSLWGTWMLILVVNAYGEETGWRGFALPRLRQRHNALEASSLLFIPWALCRVPAFSRYAPDVRFDSDCHTVLAWRIMAVRCCVAL
jgi:hypothetical protein